HNRQADQASASEASQNVQEVPYKTVRLHREKAQGDRIGLSSFSGLDNSRGSGGARPRRGKRVFRLKSMYNPIPVTTPTMPSSLPSTWVTLTAIHIALVASRPRRGKRGSSSIPALLLK